MKKLDVDVIFIDIDGTLTDSKRQVSDINSSEIKKVVESGKTVIICSGRNNMYVRRYSKKACTSNKGISSNGALVYDYENNSIIYESEISWEDVLKAWKFAYEKEISITFNCLNTRYGSKYTVQSIKEDEVIVIDDENIERLKDEKIHQISINGESYEKMTSMIDHMTKDNDLIVTNCAKGIIEKNSKADKYYADFNNCTCSKGEAIKNYLEINKINKEKVLCFGDHVNDIKMFEQCGIKVAMKNARPELKEKADYITLSNDNDGVGRFLEKYI